MERVGSGMEVKMKYSLKKYWGILLLMIILIISGCSSNKGDNYASHLPTNEMRDEFTTAFYNCITVNVLPPESDASQTADVEVSIPDLASIYKDNKDAFGNADNVDDIKQILLTHFKDHYIETTISENVYKDGDIWKLTSTQQINALIYKSVDEYLEALATDIGVGLEVGDESFEKMVEEAKTLGEEMQNEKNN